MLRDEKNQDLILFTAIFLLALAIRLLNLGSAPLSDYEAAQALQALHIARGEPTLLAGYPAYTVLTAGLFYLLDATNFIARLLPALAGSLLVFVPLMFKSLINRKAALILAIGLAFNPGLVALSRLVGSPIVAISFILLMLGLIYIKKPILAGICAGLAILSGPSLIQGIVGAGFAWIVGYIFSRIGWIQPLFPENAFRQDQPHALRRGLITGSATIIIAGSMFLLVPNGLGNIAETIPAYLSTWINSSQIPASRLLAAFFLYQPLAVVFGTIGVIRGWLRHDNLEKWVSLLLLGELVLTLILPGRLVSDLGWTIVPLLLLAALEISRYFTAWESEDVPALIQALLIFLLFALGWLNLTGMALTGGEIELVRLRWAVVLGTLALAGITTLLVALGWSKTIAFKGLVWGLIFGLGLFGFASMWWVTQLRANSEQELWYPTPLTQQANQLTVTLGDLSEWKTGFRDQIDVVVTTNAPSIEWLLHDFPNTRFISEPITGESPSVIISLQDQPQPNLPGAYRGQDFSWWATPGWQGALPPDWTHWLVFRTGPREVANIILWARGDLFLGGQFNPQEEVPTSSQPSEQRQPPERIPPGEPP
jgi:hypothetical protein